MYAYKLKIIMVIIVREITVYDNNKIRNFVFEIKLPNKIYSLYGLTLAKNGILCLSYFTDY